MFVFGHTKKIDPLPTRVFGRGYSHQGSKIFLSIVVGGLHLAKSKSGKSKKRFPDFNFMYLEGRHQFITTPEDLLDFVENEASAYEPAPKAIFRPDVTVEKWTKALPLNEKYNIDDFYTEAILGSDPDEDNYIPIPFPLEFANRIRNQYLIDFGEHILSNSRASQEYFKHWFKMSTLDSSSSAIGAAPKAFKRISFSTVILSFFIIISIVSGIVQNNLSGVLMQVFFLALILVFVQILAKEKHQNASEAHRNASNSLSRQRGLLTSKVEDFLERNPWYAEAFEEVKTAASERAEIKISELQEKIIVRRKLNEHIDGDSDLDNEIDDYFDLDDIHEEEGVDAEQKRMGQIPTRMSSFSPEQYELYCAGWIEYLGGSKVQVTKYVADGGVDVSSKHEVAQVKLHASPVGVPPIRQIFGVAKAEEKTPIFFTSKGYTKAAITFAEENDIILFVADPLNENLIGVTKYSKSVIKNGLNKDAT